MSHRQAAVATTEARARAPGAALLGRARRLLRLETLVLAICVVPVCAFYFWTAGSGLPGTGVYASLADGFLDGHTYLAVDPPPELLALPDPYDPEQNAPYRIHDASLYDGHWYLYFGPTPVVLVYMPLKLVGVEPTDEMATALLASVGFVFAVLLMAFLVRRYRPQTSLATRAAAALLLGLASVAPFVLRRPGYWEVAITAGYCCLTAGLYLTLTGALRSRPSIARMAGGSLALGLAVGARPHLALAFPVWLWAWNYALSAHPEGRRRALRLLAIVAAPLAACLVLLVVYNLVRFGSLTELGQTYQLGGTKTGVLDRFDLTRIVPGLWFYLLSPPALDVVFPFVSMDPTSYPGTLSAAYQVGIEPVVGTLVTTSIAALAFAAPVLLVRAGRGRAEDMTVASMLLVAAVLILLVPIVTFNGATQRYGMDYATLLLLAALLVWLRIETAVATRRLAGVVVRTVAAGAAIVAILFGLALSITGYADGLRRANPETYATLERTFGWVPAIAAWVRGEPVLRQVTPQAAPTEVTAIRMSAPGAGVMELKASFEANPALPQGSVAVLHVAGSDGVERRVPLAKRVMTVKAGLSGGGTQTVTVRWELLRYAGPVPATGVPPAGFAVAGARVVGWTAE